MDQDGRVWKWTGMVLAVLCAGLGIVHVVLTQVESAPPGDSQKVQLNEPAAGSLAATDRAPGKDHHFQPSPAEFGTAPGAVQTPFADTRFEISEQKKLREPQLERESVRRLESDQSRTESKKTLAVSSPPPGSIDNRQSAIIQSLRPLGIVESAGGRVQAVIQDGEWTRLVEAGEILADGARVARVSAEGVEIIRPASEPMIELARAGKAAPTETKTEIAVAAMDAQSAEVDEPVGGAEPVQARASRPASTPGRSADDLPGIQTGEATFHAAVPKPATSAVSQRPLKPVLTNETAPRPLPVVGIQPPVDPNVTFGRVEYANGRVQSVVADGQWVKLVAETGGDFDQARGAAITESPGPKPDSQKTPMTLAGGTVGLPTQRSDLIQDSQSVIPNSVEPIGIVEWPDGRTQAVIIEGLSVNLVDDSETLAETRRALALIPSPQESGIDPRLYDAERAGRHREEESAGLALMQDESPTRGPPGELEPPLGLPDELARGQPEDGGLADPSRAPPTSDHPRSNLFEENLPGFEDVAAARTEPLQSIKSIPDAILGRRFGGVTGSVSKIHPENASKPLSQAEPSPIREQDPGPRVLGHVRLLDGRERTIVSAGDSVLLVEEAVDAEAAQSNPLASPEHETLASHPQTGETHPTAGEPSGSMLQSGARIRDNQGQLHR